MKESYLYQKLADSQVECQTCAHHCLIKTGQRGICGVRQNSDGRLFVLNYGRAVAAQIDPVEKKPLFHFLPGSQTYSLAAVGCNFRCVNCQNWQISQVSKQPELNTERIESLGYPLPPEEIIKQAQINRCPSISYTYTEPTIFLEYALDTMKLAKKTGLKNIWVSNGFMSEETIKLISPFLDAANIDLKSFDDNFYRQNCGAGLEPVLNSLLALKKAGIWLEITTLVIPSLSDSEKIFEQIALFIKNELGVKTPWHLSRFFPEVSWHAQKLPATPIESLQKARQIGLSAGLKNVYIENI